MLTPATVRRAFLTACRLDVAALKPGNVSQASAGHGMHAQDFLRSARRAAPFMAAPDLSVGERILQAVRATHAAVGCNTNLGIVLLCAPLASALHSNLGQVLRGLTVQDAQQTFEAIVLASPGGLGTAPRHDVRGAARVTLRQAMTAAARRDRIAWQYAHEFRDVLCLGLPWARHFLARGWAPAWAMTAVFLGFLGRFPDSHVARKHGLSTARAVSREGLVFRGLLESASDPQRLRRALAHWDVSLKRRAINPGTSADLSVATWFALGLEEALKKG